MVSREIQALQLIGGAPLTPAEQKQAAHITQIGLRADPQAWAKDDAGWARALQRVAAHDRILEATVQENSRLSMEKGVSNVPSLQEAANMEYVIVRARDPTIAYVAFNLVTEASLRALVQAVAWTSLHGSLPPEPADLVATERDLIRRGYASYPAELQTAYAHIGRNFATAAAFMSEVRQGQVVPYLQGHLAQEPKALQAGPGSAVALVMQDLYNETVRRKWSPRNAMSGATAAMENMMRMRIMRLQFDGLRRAYGRDVP